MREGDAGSFSFQRLSSIPPFGKGGQGGICLRQPYRNPPAPLYERGEKGKIE